MEPIVYNGCSTTKQETTLFKGINLPNKFYGLDKTSNSLQFLTTLFWDAGLLTNINGEAEFSFITADLSGEYKIILQGITVDNTVYGKIDIAVKP